MKKIFPVIGAILIISCILLSGCVSQTKNDMKTEKIEVVTQIPITLENVSQVEKSEGINPVNQTKIELNSTSGSNNNDALPWANKFL